MTDRRPRILLGIAILFIVGNIIFMQLVTHPQARKVRIQGEIERIRAERLATAKKEYDDLVSRKATLQNTLSDVSYFFGQMVTGEKEGFERVRKSLQKIADDSGIPINNIGYSMESEEKQQLVTMRLSFQLTGTYEQIRQFLSEVEGAQVFLMIDSIDLSAGGQEGDNVTLNIRLSTLLQRAS